MSLVWLYNSRYARVDRTPSKNFDVQSSIENIISVCVGQQIHVKCRQIREPLLYTFLPLIPSIIGDSRSMGWKLDRHAGLDPEHQHI